MAYTLHYTPPLPPFDVLPPPPAHVAFFAVPPPPPAVSFADALLPPSVAAPDNEGTWSIYIYLSYSSGLAPLKMYGELQRDMGPYRTVRIALHMFTRFTSKRVSCMFRRDTYTFYIVTYVRSSFLLIHI